MSGRERAKENFCHGPGQNFPEGATGSYYCCLALDLRMLVVRGMGIAGGRQLLSADGPGAGRPGGYASGDGGAGAGILRERGFELARKNRGNIPQDSRAGWGFSRSFFSLAKNQLILLTFCRSKRNLSFSRNRTVG